MFKNILRYNFVLFLRNAHQKLNLRFVFLLPLNYLLHLLKLHLRTMKIHYILRYMISLY